MYLKPLHARVVVAALTVTAVLASPARAKLFDPAGDFLSTYAGPHNGDLDVISVDAVRSGDQSVTLTGTQAATVGTTSGAAYVWGINRGQGVEPFPTFDPPTGKGIVFDAYVILTNEGTGTITDLINHTVKTLDPATIAINGSTISVTLPSSLLPTTGFAFANYLYNLWPRYAPEGVSPGDNRQISDFAPDASSFAASVPEPSAVAMTIASLGGIALAVLRRAKR